MGSEELFITWNNHHRNVVGAFGRYLAEETLVDCTIAAEGESLKVHKLVLSACSSYFELLFSQEMYKGELVVLEDVKFKDLKSLITFMYEGQVTIPKDRLWDYVKAAELLQIKGLPRDLVLNALREATDMSVECRKEAVASQLSNERMKCSAIVSESSSLQCVSSISRNQPGDETLSTCMQTDPSEEDGYLQPQNTCESDSKRETAKFPAEKEPSGEPKEEVDVVDNPIWDSEDENTSAVTDITSATASENVQSELTVVQGTVSSRSSCCSSPHNPEKEIETSVYKFSSVTASIPSSTNIVHSTPLVPNVPTEQSGCAIEHSSFCEQTALSEQIICVKKETLVESEVIPAVISLERESVVEPMQEVWMEELQCYEDQELIIETDSADTFNEQTTIQDVDIAAAATDNCQPVVLLKDIFKADDSACVEAQRDRKEFNTVGLKKESEIDEECIAGECTNIDVNVSTVDKVVESGPHSVIEIVEDCVVEQEEVIAQEMTVERALKADVAVEQSEAEEEDSTPLSERISKILGMKSHRCLRCTSVFCTVHELQTHVRNLHKKKSSNKRCEVCEVTFALPSLLARHMKRHRSEHPFKCDVCSESFSRKVHLNRHKQIHMCELPFLCDVCKRSFRDKTTLAMHLRSHTGERPFQCNVCKKSFVHNCNRNRHMLAHTGVRPFHCNDCQKSFLDKGGLTRHIRIHTIKRPFQCNVCKMSFTQKCYLTTHMLKHAGKDCFQCSVCQKPFSGRGPLIVHLRVHSGERPYQCNVCQKSFKINGDLTKHIRTHTGERPFQCNVCHKSFSQKFNCTVHMRLHTAQCPS